MSLFEGLQKPLLELIIAEEAHNFSCDLRAMGLNDEQRMWAFQTLAISLLCKKGPPRDLKFSQENLKNKLYFIATELDDFLEGIRERFNELSKDSVK